MPEDGRLRLAVDIARWHPSIEELEFLYSLLPPADAEDCKKFRFFDDKKRSVTSRLLQRHAAFLALGIPHPAVDIKRTKGRKPYVANPIPNKQHSPNYNYSVSHEVSLEKNKNSYLEAPFSLRCNNLVFSSHLNFYLISILQGDYVVLASEGFCICGCDVAAPHQLRRNAGQSLNDVLSSFTNQLTPAEWAVVRKSPGDELIESQFRKFWSLKEAFVKATGEGLGFDLGRCEFKLIDGPNGEGKAAVAVDGVPQPNWTFFLHEFGRNHWVSVARAPMNAVVDAWGGFKATFQLPAVPAVQHGAALAAVETPFTMLTISDLIPVDRRNDYEAAGGELL